MFANLAMFANPAKAGFMRLFAAVGFLPSLDFALRQNGKTHESCFRRIGIGAGLA
ncbi:MAG: hypothetical protein ACR2P5_09710 [Gammaproteobacteria bacterium]